MSGKRRLVYSIIIAILYLTLGNTFAILGMKNISNSFYNNIIVQLIFLPYTFIGGMSTYAGWDWSSIVLESVIFVISIPIIFSTLRICSLIKAGIIEKINKEK